VSIETVVDGWNAIWDTVGAPLNIALFYWFRFHTLKGTRSYTTKILFIFGVVAFITPFLVIYLLLPEKMSPLAGLWLLIFVWLIPGVPAAWRGFCQSLAGIPSRAFGLRDLLAASDFEVRPDDLPALRRKLGRIGYQLDDFRAVQSTAIQSRFLKISAIMLHLEQWVAKHENFIERNSEHYSDLLCVYDSLCFRTVRVLKSSAEIYGAIMEESGVEPDDWSALDSLATRNTSISQLQLAAQTAAGCMLEDLRKDLDALLNNLLPFVARAALAGEWTLSGRKRRLEAIGFTVDTPASGIMWPVVIAAAVTVGWSLLWLLALRKLDKNGSSPIPGNMSAGLGRMFIVSPLEFMINFWLVNYFKRYYAFANEGLFKRLPLAFILSVGLLSALMIFPVQAYFDLYQFGDKEGYLWVLLHELPLLIFPWGIGAMTATLVQDSMWGSVSRKEKQVRDGLVFGAGLTLLVLVLLVLHWSMHIPAMESVANNTPLMIVAELLLPTFGFGFVVGYLVMGRLREVSSRYPTDEALISHQTYASA